MATVILGSGIVGVSTAYYLSQSQDPSTIHLVDPSPTLFASASGLAGGFLARDWFQQSVAALGALSFEEHRLLAEKFGGAERWGFAWNTAWNHAVGGDGEEVDGSERKEEPTREVPAPHEGEGYGNGHTGGPIWLKRNAGDEVERVSGKLSTAVVDPLQLSTFLLQTCVSQGVRLHHPARAISIHLDVQDALSSIRILDTKTQTESDIPCTKILIAAGAWSPHVFSTLFPTAKREIPISSLAGHSLLARASTPGEVLEGEEKICHAVFVEDNAGVFSFAPELFERRSGEIYIAGLNDPYLPLPSLPTEAKIDEKSAQTLKEVAKKLMSSEDGQDVELVRIGLCFRPISDRGSGVPILGSIPDADLGISTRDGSEGGVWLAAGHGPWGISLSLGTGKVMAEMIAGRTTSVDVRALRL